jgi:tRNA modification GTPase
MADDTIAAIATASGEGGIGIIRLSGPKAIEIADRIFRAHSKVKIQDQKNFTVRLGQVVDPTTSAEKVLDEVLALVMRGPKSYTGQDIVELSCHGGIVVLQEILSAALKAGARLADPGEYTKRAFLNGRMDLIQAEAVLDVIHAKTEKNRQWASAQLEGSLSRQLQKLKSDLVEILSHLEAGVDFPDDFPDTDSRPVIQEKLRRVYQRAKDLLSGADLALLSKRGLNVVIWGRPNVGKSSLFNALVKKNRVIVTPYPGTTRDIVDEEISIEGFLIRLHDTAGVHATDQPIEMEGIERSKKAVQGADLVLFVVDGSQGWLTEDQKLYEALGSLKRLLIINKSDLTSKIDTNALSAIRVDGTLSLSCFKEDGVLSLEKELACFMRQGSASSAEEGQVTTVRQKELLEQVSKDLERAMAACDKNLSEEFVASDVNSAVHHLGELVGEVVTEDILERIFQQFCIGK